MFAGVRLAESPRPLTGTAAGRNALYAMFDPSGGGPATLRSDTGDATARLDPMLADAFDESGSLRQIGRRPRVQHPEGAARSSLPDASGPGWPGWVPSLHEAWELKHADPFVQRLYDFFHPDEPIPPIDGPGRFPPDPCDTASFIERWMLGCVPDRPFDRPGPVPFAGLFDFPPPPRGVPTMAPPAYTAQEAHTRACFEESYGSGQVIWPQYEKRHVPPIFVQTLTDWPTHDCCPPLADVRAPVLPSTAGIEVRVRSAYDDWPPDWPYENHLLDPFDPGDVATLAAAEELYRATLALLRENLDLVEWAVCLTHAWTPDEVDGVLLGGVSGPAPDLVSCLLDLVSGAAPSHVTFISLLQERDQNGDPSTDTGAFGTGGSQFCYDPDQKHSLPDGTVGVVLPMEHSWWAAFLNDHGAGGDDAFCALLGAATIVLHEMTHICTRGHGPVHGIPLSGCWDEQQGVATIFAWAMMQRYPSLTTLGKHCCQHMANESWFYYSRGYFPREGC